MLHCNTEETHHTHQPYFQVCDNVSEHPSWMTPSSTGTSQCPVFISSNDLKSHFTLLLYSFSDSSCLPDHVITSPQDLPLSQLQTPHFQPLSPVFPAHSLQFPNFINSSASVGTIIHTFCHCHLSGHPLAFRSLFAYFEFHNQSL